ncbi:unnamed protein product [Closterium sp. Naga37s-1]|nr:unnamed protein product [Closterium sp. Naga37s-1]
MSRGVSIVPLKFPPYLHSRVFLPTFGHVVHITFPADTPTTLPLHPAPVTSPPSPHASVCLIISLPILFPFTILKKLVVFTTTIRTTTMASLLATPVRGLAAGFASNAESSDASTYAVRSSSSSSARLASFRGTGFDPLRHVRASTYRRRASAAIRQVSASADKSASEASSATEEKSSVTSPFAGKKISTLLAARAAAASKAATSSSSGSPSTAEAPVSPPAAAESAFPAPPTPAFPSSFAKSLPASTPTSPFASPAASASPSPPRASPAPTPAPADRSSVNAVVGGTITPKVSFRGKAIVDAFKQGSGGSAKGGASKGVAGVTASSSASDPADGRVRMGSPRAPANIFNEVARTPEEIEAEKWRFQVVGRGEKWLGKGGRCVRDACSA